MKPVIFLLIFSLCFYSSGSSLPERKLFYHNGVREDIRLLTKNQVESRLVAAVFRVFSSEVLGYDIIVKNQSSNSDSRPLSVQSQTLYSSSIPLQDSDLTFRQLSSCTNPLCDDYTSNPAKDSPPGAMLSLDLELPPSDHVDTWDLLDGGQLGPAVRLGWFVSRTGEERLTHWKLLTQPAVASYYRPSKQQFAYLQDKLSPISTDGLNCSLEGCRDGIFSPPACKDSECSLLLASHQVLSTKSVLKHIVEERLRVQVAWLGDHLDAVIAHFTSTSTPFLLLHYTPSSLILKYRLRPVMFPACKDPLLRRDGSDAHCVYAPNRLAKVVWSPVQNEAPSLYRFIQHFGFSYSEYVQLLTTYNAHMEAGGSPVDYHGVACSWLQTPTDGGKSSIYRDILANFPFQDKPELYIGGIFPITGSKYKAPELAKVAQMAVEDVNSDNTTLSNYKLVLSINDGKCEADVVMKKFIDIIKTKDNTRFRSTVGMLGPACSDTVEPIAGVSKHFRTVVISYSAEGSISSDNRQDYPYFFRTIAENKQYKHAYVTALQKLGWRKVAALTQDGAKYSDYMSELQDKFQKNNIEFIMNRKFPKEATDMRMYLQDLKDRGAKIIIGEFYASSARHIMCAAYQLKMTQREGYAWFLPGWFDNNWYDIDELKRINNETEGPGLSHRVEMENSYDNQSQGGTIDIFDDIKVGDLPDCTTSQMVEALNGHLSLVHANFAPEHKVIRGNRTVAEWKEALREKMRLFKHQYDQSRHRQSGGNNSHHDNFQPSSELPMNKYSGYVYDAVWLYALALQTLVSNQETQSFIQNLHSQQTVTEFQKIISNTDFYGVSGRINFNGRPSRLSEVKILQFHGYNSSNMSETQIGRYVPYYTDDEGSHGYMKEWENSRIRWMTETGEKPPDNPKECGILSSFATKFDIECQLAITIVFIIGFVILLFIIFVMFVVLKIRYERKMKQAEDRMRQLGLLTPTSVLTLDEWEIPRDRVVINRKLGEGAFGTVYGGEAFFDEKGWVAVAVKTLKVGSSLEEKIDFLSEADMMKRFDHRNIVKLLGVCTRNEPVYTVMEFMLYGDLKTYLLARRHLVKERNREDMDEVSNRRLTCMAYDVARGLEYLADLKYVHRDVACRNCLVNAGRTVKLADFGMTRPMFESDYYRFSKKGMLPVRWMSPESLTDGLFAPSSDIWSYGVLLYEMITFGSFPFQGQSNNQVLNHIKSGNTLTVPQGIKEQMRILLKNCWSFNPVKRPNASEIVELLSNNPRLVSPSIDVPLASVQIERCDEIELITGRQRKPSNHNKEAAVGEAITVDDPGYSSSEYSPMHGLSLTQEQEEQEDEMVVEEEQEEEEMGATPLLSNSHQDYYQADDQSNFATPEEGSSFLQVSSYVPPGYMVLDQSRNRNNSDYDRFQKFSVSSL